MELWLPDELPDDDPFRALLARITTIIRNDSLAHPEARRNATLASQVIYHGSALACYRLVAGLVANSDYRIAQGVWRGRSERAQWQYDECRALLEKHRDDPKYIEMKQQLLLEGEVNNPHSPYLD